MARSRLLNVLAQVDVRKLALVTGSPGYGKTTLLAQLRQHCLNAGADVAWVSLIPEDEGFVDFCAVLLAALQRIGVVDASEATVGAGSAALVETTAALIVEGAAALPKELYLMLDDYHYVADAWAHKLLQRVIDFAPPNLHIVMVARVVPPLSLSRLRVMDQVIEMDATELPFDLGETRAFLDDLLRAGRVGPDEVAQAYAITGGWPACLQLVSAMLRQKTDARTALCDVLRRSSDLQTYLSEAILALLPPRSAAFLEGISMLRRVTPALAEAVTGEATAAELLKRMEEVSLLISRVESGDAQPWYRLHPLFSEFLAARVARDGPVRVAGLHRRAAQWFADHGLLAEAVRHATLVGDTALAVQVIEGSAPAVWSLEYIAPTRRLLERLPEETLLDHPSLFYLASLTFALAARHGRVERWLAEWEARGAAGHAPVGERELSLVRAIVALQRDDASQVIALLQPQLDAVPADAFRRYVMVSVLATAYALAGRFADACRLLDRYPTPASQRNDEIAMVAETARIRCLLLEGNANAAWQQAASLYGRALERYGANSICASLAAPFLADACYELDRTATARETIANRPGLLCSASPDVVTRNALCRARLDLLRAGPEAALAFLREQVARMRELGLDRPMAHLFAEQVRICLGLGDRMRADNAASDLAELAERYRGACGSYEEIGMLAELVSARLAAGAEPERALRSLDAAAVRAQALGRGQMLALTDLLRAAVLDDLDRPQQAFAAATAAFARGARLGLVRTFIDEGPLAAAQVRRVSGASADAALSGYLAMLEATLFPQRVPAAAPLETSAAGTPKRVLTQREVEILGLVAQAMSNKRIALSLGITLQTVKWNLRNIFAKLDVSSRYDAMVQARQHNLIH
ncbi:helix-turn-helix transcriptional regulator [Cupriavidus taiwanensis]|uniref:helix-turn-helix transcriptional regulator n=1 Tax=Cupriavidus taiwanensis TaxID=164546 RepID=UPI0015F285AC|nr:LuxR C-terminal-related transcriptional regulator [Cupriavidus taiwanensis]